MPLYIYFSGDDYMSMNETPSGDRLHIGIFGRRNAGKSSLINALTGQSLAIVSDIKGTTTDPVSKSMEILPLGPVVIIDTPGIDDDGELGELRIQKSYQVLNKTDIAVLVVDAAEGLAKTDYDIIEKFKDKNIPYVIVMNKSDLTEEQTADEHTIWVSAQTGRNINELREFIAKQKPSDEPNGRLIADLVKPLDIVVLVVPIDSAAPKGRLILPQQQTIRDLLEAGAVSVVVRDTELKQTLEKITPSLVVTDSQAFASVSRDTPENILLTSFSILFARYKGELKTAVEGVTMIDKLSDGDTILISEGCTHHRQCDDIGTVKLPRWIKEYTKKDINFEFSSGTGFPNDLSKYSMIIHCGACMLNKREMQYRIRCARDAKIPFTNYGITIAYIKGILKRSVEVFPDIYKLLK